MAGHGSPPPEDRAHHPNRQVAQIDTQRWEEAGNDPLSMMRQMHGWHADMARIDAEEREVWRRAYERGGPMA